MGRRGIKAFKRTLRGETARLLADLSLGKTDGTDRELDHRDAAMGRASSWNTWAAMAMRALGCRIIYLFSLLLIWQYQRVCCFSQVYFLNCWLGS